MGVNIPNHHKIYKIAICQIKQISIKSTKWPKNKSKLFKHMAIHIFHFYALKYLPKLGTNILSGNPVTDYRVFLEDGSDLG
jgi:hypothetical protein